MPLDLNWRNLFAAAIDQITLAAVKREKTILIQAADVPRFKPTIDKALAIKFRGIEIARNHRWSAHQNFALFARGKPPSILPYDHNRIRPGNTARARL